MPIPPRLPGAGGAADGAFVDRVDEAEAMRRSLAAHRQRIDADIIDGAQCHHVLVYFGTGGTGKTELSTHLSRWVMGAEDHPAHWGSTPLNRVAAVARWELNDSQGGLDAYDLLLELRRAFGDVKREWRAFDLAFAAFANALRRTDDVPLSRSRGAEQPWKLSDVVSGALSDAATLADVAGGGLAAPAVTLVGNMLTRRLQSARTRKLLAEWEGLEDLLADCQGISGAEAEVAALASRVAYQLSLEVDRMPPRERPMIVVFVDHLERLQGTKTSGEQLLHQLVLALPYVLFVITGRKSLKWADPAKTHLKQPGPRTWPGLVLSDPPPSEPRQHVVGNLAAADAQRMLRSRLTQVGARVGPGLVEELADVTDGWPLHLDAIVSLAAHRSGERELTIDDLGGPLPAVVNRLFEDLDAEQQAVFQAACLLPYFDARLVAVAAGTSVGAAERFTQRTLVLDNPGSPYPHRLHDDIRAIVRETGSQAHFGWSEADWQKGARLAVGEAKDRFEQAMQTESDQAAVHALALALNVCAENGIFDEWLIAALRRSPSLIGLSPLVPAAVKRGAEQDMDSVLAFVRACGHPISSAKLHAMTEVEARDRANASDAGLWRAYTLRSLGRWEEAIEQFEHLLRTYGDRPSLYAYQLLVTHRTARRFEEVMANLGRVTEPHQQQMIEYLNWRHGRAEGAPATIRARIDEAQGKSRRFAVELWGNWLVARNHAGDATPEDVEKVQRMALSAGHHTTIVNATGVLALLNLFDTPLVEECLATMRMASHARGNFGSLASQILALRGWVTQDDSLIDRARELALSKTRRDGGWIGLECLLDHLGRPLPPAPTEWLEPYEVVRQRWVEIYIGMIDRAKEAKR